MLCAAASASGITALPLQCSKFNKLPTQKQSHISPELSKFNSFPQFLGFLHVPNRINLSKSAIIAVKCSSNSSELGASDQNLSPQDQSQEQENVGFWEKWKVKSTAMSAKMAKLGLSAVLAYGLFDGVTYTTFFVLAFLGYEKSAGKNPAANLQALIGIVLLMWTGNNVTRPFRVAGAAALAPVVDKGLRKIQKALNFPRLVYAFALVVGIVATTCLTIAGLLILSRWGK